MQKVKYFSLLFFSFLFLIAINVNGQKIKYTYDAAGNRVLKQIDMNRKANPFTDNVGGLEIKIYPNPTTKVLHIEIPEVNEEQGSLAIFDNTGKMIYNQTSIHHTNEIDMMNKSKGNYILKLINGKDVSSWVIIKN